MNNEFNPYNPYTVFWELLLTNFANLRARALRRLNIIKIFSKKNLHINSKTLITVFGSLVGSIFEYSFFSVIYCSKLIWLPFFGKRKVKTIEQSLCGFFVN